MIHHEWNHAGPYRGGGLIYPQEIGVSSSEFAFLNNIFAALCYAALKDPRNLKKENNPTFQVPVFLDNPRHHLL